MGIAFLELDIFHWVRILTISEFDIYTDGYLDGQFYRSPLNLISARVINVTFSGKKIAKFSGRRRLENIK